MKYERLLRPVAERLKMSDDPKHGPCTNAYHLKYIESLESQLAAAQKELEALRKEYDEEVISHDIEETDLKARLEEVKARLKAQQSV